MTKAPPVEPAGARKAPQSKRELDAVLRAIFEKKVPFNQVLGLKVVSTDPASPRVRFDMRPDLIGNPNRQTLHVVFTDYDDVKSNDPRRLYNPRYEQEVRNEWKYNLSFVKIDINRKTI